MTTRPATGLELRSRITAEGLDVSLQSVPVPTPGPNEVLVRVDAAPINPSDLGLLFGAADMKTATLAGSGDGSVLTAKVSEGGLKAMAARLGQSMTVGNEGAGVVIEAGSSEAAQALNGKMVAVLGGGMYAHYRCVPVSACLPLPAGTKAADAAGAFINPLTALGMVETLRFEKHTALVHNAAASSLGQMLIRLCQAENIGLVNIVRKPEQVEMLKALGAKYVVNSTSPTFVADLTEAIAATGATLAFDPAGGGAIAGQILTAMEVVINRSAKEYSRYGSAVHKQVYVYGGLDMSPTELKRNWGMAWGIGGWLVFPYLQKIGAETAARLRARVAKELTTTFATRYVKEVSLAEVLQPKEVAAYGARSTDGKYLIVPNRA